MAQPTSPTTSPPPQTSARERSSLDKFLGLFTEVRAGEAPIALLLSLNVFLLLAAYYIIKPAREDLLSRSAGEAEYGTYLSAAIAVLMFIVVPLYAKLVDRMIRTRLISVVTTVFILCLVIFYILGQAEVPYLGFVFFVWVGIFNVFVVAQFWAFANDVYDSDSGKRLFPIVAVGGNLGAVAGAYVFPPLLKQISTYQALLLCGVLLAFCILLTQIIGKRVFRGSSVAPDAKKASRTGGLLEGFDLLFKHRFLGFIALLVLLLNVVNTTGEYILRSLFYQTAEAQAANTSREELVKMESLDVGKPRSEATTEELREALQGETVGTYYGHFFFWVNVLAVVFQLLLTPRLVRYGGVGLALLMLPVLAFGTYLVAALFPILAYVRPGKILENASDYSVNNTARHMLFLPLATDIKYKSKQATDSFMQRAGDVISAGLVFVGTTTLALSISGFAFFNLAVIAVWLILVYLIVRDFRAIEAGANPELTGKAATQG